MTDGEDAARGSDGEGIKSHHGHGRWPWAGTRQGPHPVLCMKTLAPGSELCWNMVSSAPSIILKPWGTSHHRSAPRYGLRHCLRCLNTGCTASSEPDITRAVGEGFVRDQQQGRCEDALLKCNSATGTRTVFLHMQLK